MKNQAYLENFVSICKSGKLIDISGSYQKSENLCYGVFAAVKAENYANLDILLPVILRRKDMLGILKPGFNLAFEYFEKGFCQRLNYLDNNFFLTKALTKKVTLLPRDTIIDTSASMRSPTMLEAEIWPYQKNILEYNLHPKSLVYILKAYEIDNTQIERAFVSSIDQPEVAKILLEHKLEVIKDSKFIKDHLNRSNLSDNDRLVKKWLDNMLLGEKLSGELDDKEKKKTLKI